MKTQIKVLGKVAVTVEGEWDINKEYDDICIVSVNNRASYISKTKVPKGIEITNKDYWQIIGSSNNVAGFNVEIVQSLPSTGELGTIYLVKDTTSGVDNHYIEYLWIDSINDYEILGRFKTEVDLSNYQEKLVSGDNIKTVNGQSILGKGDIEIEVADPYTLPLAAANTRGGIKLGFNQTNKKYPVKVENEKAYVEVPWTDTDTTYKNATTTTPGLMSAEDKVRLDGLTGSSVEILTLEQYNTKDSNNELEDTVIYVIK